MFKLLELYQVSTKLTMANSLNEIYDIIVDALSKILKLNSFAILIREGDKLKDIRRCGIEKPAYPLKLNGKGITVACYNSGKTIYSPDVTKDDRYVESSSKTRSELAVPIKYREKIFGVINIESPEYNAFSPDEIEMLEIFASMVAAAIQNVEYKKQMEASERKYRSIFENAVEGIYRLDGSGKVIEVNPSLEKLFGYTQQELKNIDLSTLYKDPASRKKFLEEVRKKGSVKNYEVEYVRKDGKIIIGNEFAILVKEGGIEYIDGIIHDITDLKKAIRESEFYNSLLRHDIANKLQVIYGYLEIIHDNLQGEEKEMVEVALNSAKSAMKLIDEIRKLRKLKGAEKHKLNLKRIIEEIAEEYEKEMRDRGIKAEYKLKDVFIEGSEFIKEAIANIIWNAITHSKGDKIKIWIEENTGVCINIEDNGIGIPKDIKNQIFEMGVKGSHSNGSGLGLYLAKKIVEENGGRIEARDGKERGTLFKIFFPNK